MDDIPTEHERRLVLRLLGYWRDLRGDRAFPSFDEIDPAQILDLWPHCFLLDATGGRLVFRSAGTVAMQYAGGKVDGLVCSIASNDTLIEKSVDYFDEVLRLQVPISRGGELVRSGGLKMLYRSILLPVSDDGARITGLLGAVNYRDVALNAGTRHDLEPQRTVEVT